jgi:hypothetical protein
MSSSQGNPDGLTAARPLIASLTNEIVGDVHPPSDAAPRAHRRDEGETLLPEGIEIPTQEIEAALGEPFSHTLDVASWDRGLTHAALEKLETQIADAVRQEHEIVKTVRKEVFPLIEGGEGAPSCAGVYQATLDDIDTAQRKVLFNVGVAAVDGTVKSHDTLPLTITQIGVSLVSYAGEQGAWTHRVFRRELRAKGPEVSRDEVLDALLKRRGRGGVGQPDKKRKEGRMSELLGRGLMSYSERVVLADHAETPWRMGHGTLAPYELLTGSGNMDLLHAGLAAVRRLVDHEQFVFVPSADGDRLLLTLGLALRPLEYAIVHSDEERMRGIVRGGHYGQDHAHVAESFVDDVGPAIVVGVYRTYADVPAQVFYAHSDTAHEAAIIAMADSVLQSHRGFPTLIDVADIACKAYTGLDAFVPGIQAGYSRSGSPLLFLPERETRG